MRCNNCGTENEDNAIFCEFCGKRFEAPNEFKTRNIPLLISIVTICVLAVLIVFFIVYIIINKNDNTDNNVNNSLITEAAEYAETTTDSNQVSQTTKMSTTTTTTTSSTTTTTTTTTTTSAKLSEMYIPNAKHYYPGENEGDLYVNDGVRKYLLFGPDESKYDRTGGYIDSGELFNEQGRIDSVGTWLLVKNSTGEIGWVKNNSELVERVQSPKNESTYKYEAKILNETPFRLGPNDKRDFVNKIYPSCPKIIPSNSDIYVFSFEDGWYYIRYGSNYGWVRECDVD